jgi:hypothetical protein
MESGASVYLDQKLGTLHTVNIGTLIIDCTAKETNILSGQFCQVSCSLIEFLQQEGAQRGNCMGNSVSVDAI